MVHSLITTIAILAASISCVPFGNGFQNGRNFDALADWNPHDYNWGWLPNRNLDRLPGLVYDERGFPLSSAVQYFDSPNYQGFRGFT